MTLKCKLQKPTAQPALIDKSDKLLFSFLQNTTSLFSTSQFFLLVSFFSLIGFFIWFTSSSSSTNTSSESNEEQNESDEKANKKRSTNQNVTIPTSQNEEEEVRLRAKQQQAVSLSPSRNSLDGRLNTIYEDLINEKSLERTNPSSSPTVTKSVEIGRDSRHKPVSTSTPVSSPNVARSPQQIDVIDKRGSQKSRAGPQADPNFSIEQDRFVAKTKSIEESPSDGIDEILDGLVSDQNEQFVLSKYKNFDSKNETESELSTDGAAVEEEQASTTARNSKLRKDSGSRNSLLELYQAKHVHAIEDHFENLNEISAAIKSAGLENSQLIFGIDFTISNLENGTKTFNGRSLHFCDDEIKNPYQKVIEILGKTLENFDVDGKIPAFGFGDAKTKDRKVFPFSEQIYCNGFKDVLRKYNEILKNVQLSGPTNFAPLIKEAIKIVKQTKQYHILVIVADGQVTNERQTRDAIVEASKYALSIIMVGVGDGPWGTMNEFDDSLPKRQFDNFQFVNYHEVTDGVDNPDQVFALHALMEIPDQYKEIKQLGLLEN